MRSFIPTRHDMRALVRLAVPIVTVQVGLMLMGVVDTIMVGHVSARELAAAAMGNLYVMGLAVFGMGTLWGLDPIVSQAMGARDHEAAALGVQRGLALAAVLSVLMTLLCLPAEPIFRLLRQPPEIVPRATAYVWLSAPSMIALMPYVALRQSLQAMKHTRAIVITIVVGNLVNAALNLVFVYGNLGSPAMGAPGSALSSTIGRWVSLALLLALARRELRPVLRPLRREALAAGPFLRTLRLGLPIGGQVSVEFGSFAAISIFAGWFGAEALSGHQIAINLASLAFMVPAGIGSAAAVLVGHAIGDNDAPHARRVAASALILGVSFMALCAVVFRFAPGPFARIYTSVPEVVAIAVALIPVAGLFQVFDGVQVVSAGVLRGAGDTHAALVANLLGFWLVGIPVSLALGFTAKMGVVGLWLGFVAGLFAVALFLILRVRVKLGGELRRIQLETVAEPGTGGPA
ncbi:MAG: MATE family efflux transporter [Candidatus Eisenbacteria bacterium]|nr:MATE family efflux transporter [Candidatus Eisenbacteria bacterium]